MNFLPDLSGFFASAYDAESVLPATYSPFLVVVSFLIAALAGFAFIHLSHWIAEQKTSFVRTCWIVVGALIMGLGIWAMHFVGMIAYQLPVPIIYEPVATAASALPAVIASGLSLQMVARSQVSHLRLVLGGVVLGGGIGLMHYTGMAAMDVEAFVRYDPMLFTASILVAVILAICALWMARRRTRNPFSVVTLIREVYSAVLIGCAVAGMHYTAMSSTLCFSLGIEAGENFGMDTDLLAILTTIVATMVLLAGIAAVIFDRRLTIAIRKQERAADLAEESDRRLTEAVEAMSGSLALFDADESLVFSNSHFRVAYGLQDAADASRLSYQNVLDWHVAEKQTFRENGGKNAGENTGKNAGEALREGRDKGVPITLEGRNNSWSMIRQRRTINGGTVFLCTDVTDIRQTEVLLQQQQNRLRLIMDNVADAVLTISSAGVIESFNRAAERIFGFSAEEMVGQPATRLIATGQKTIQGNRFGHYLEKPDSRSPDSDSFEIVCQHKSGNTVFVEAVLSEVKEHGRTVIVGAFRDMTERRLNAIALEKARTQAEKASMAKSEFIAHMSHELRTPLNAVIGMSEALLMIETLRTDPAQLHEYLTDILASGRHQLTLVNDMLDLSTIESGGRSKNIERLDICAETESVIRPFVRSLDGKTVTIIPPGIEYPVFIMADRQSFNQVLINLLSNATEHAGDNLEITISLDDRSSEQSVGLTVSDNGKGMPDELLKQLGQPFPLIRSAYVRMDDDVSKASTGLGMSIVYRLMEMNGGRVTVNSTIGGGTSVTTYWLRRDAEEQTGTDAGIVSVPVAGS
tara:strand:+ start:3442 stop:5862 length:2421 start_codon:yes stop_codon:yes gene_type:complete